MSPRAAVWFAPTLAAARRAMRRAESRAMRRARNRAAARADDRLASPRSPGALVRALAEGRRVVVADPPRPDPAWERAKRRFLLPSAPGLLRDAIGGIAAREPPLGKAGRAHGPTRAHWLPGPLTDRRAAALLAAPPVPPLWIVEDFRRLRVSPAMRARLDARGIRIAAYRALPVAGKPVRSGRIGG